MAGPESNLIGAACLAGAALAMVSCSLSTPSPAGGFHHDFTPRTVGPGRMTTRLEVVQDVQLMDRLEVGALLGQTVGTKRGSQFDLVAETRTLTIAGNDSAADASDLEEEGYYLGVQYRSPVPGSQGGRYLLSYFGGAGLGAYGDYVKHVDAHAGASGGYDGKYFCPFAAAAAGFSLPYARKTFDHANMDLGGFGPAERYRYATAAWLGYELGLESPFGDRDKGFRLHMSMGQKLYQMLEDDIVADSARVISPYGLDFQYKIGLAWTY